MGGAGSQVHGLAARYGTMWGTTLSGWSSEDAVEAEVGVGGTRAEQEKTGQMWGRL